MTVWLPWSLYAPRMPRTKVTVITTPAPLEAPTARPEGARRGITFAIRDVVLGGDSTDLREGSVLESRASGPQSDLLPTRGLIWGKLLTPCFSVSQAAGWR